MNDLHFQRYIQKVSIQAVSILQPNLINNRIKSAKWRAMLQQIGLFLAIHRDLSLFKLFFENGTNFDQIIEQIGY